jgi:hypothetical protein
MNQFTMCRRDLILLLEKYRDVCCLISNLSISLQLQNSFSLIADITKNNVCDGPYSPLFSCFRLENSSSLRLLG